MKDGSSLSAPCVCMYVSSLSAQCVCMYVCMYVCAGVCILYAKDSWTYMRMRVCVCVYVLVLVNETCIEFVGTVRMCVYAYVSLV